MKILLHQQKHVFLRTHRVRDRTGCIRPMRSVHPEGPPEVSFRLLPLASSAGPSFSSLAPSFSQYSYLHPVHPAPLSRLPSILTPPSPSHLFTYSSVNIGRTHPQYPAPGPVSPYPPLSGDRSSSSGIRSRPAPQCRCPPSSAPLPPGDFSSLFLVPTITLAHHSQMYHDRLSIAFHY